MQRPHLTIGCLDFGVECARHPRLYSLPLRLCPRLIVGPAGAQLAEGLAEPLLLWYAEQLRSGLVDVQITTRWIEASDEVRRVLCQCAELLAEGTQHGHQHALTLELIAGAPLLGDILQDHHP